MTTDKDTSRNGSTGDIKNRSTRVFAMTDKDFEYVASHLQEPDKHEEPIKIDGTSLTPEAVAQKLNL
jgi:hypothetical protein